MIELIIRIRPLETMDDLDIDEVRQRAAGLQAWEAELHDSRLGDAPFVTVVARTGVPDREAVRELKAAFARLPRMTALVWRSPRDEQPLEALDPEGVVEDRT
jgi:hypothetical protein